MGCLHRQYPTATRRTRCSLAATPPFAASPQLVELPSQRLRNVEAVFRAMRLARAIVPKRGFESRWGHKDPRGSAKTASLCGSDVPERPGMLIQCRPRWNLERSPISHRAAAFEVALERDRIRARRALPPSRRKAARGAQQRRRRSRQRCASASPILSRGVCARSSARPLPRASEEPRRRLRHTRASYPIRNNHSILEFL